MHFADRLIAWLTASGAAAPAAIFALVFAESGLMLAIPGETAVLIGGALAATGHQAGGVTLPPAASSC